MSRSHIKCKKCNDLGYIITTDALGYDKAEECSCHKARRIEATLRSSGVVYEEYAAKTLNSFLVDTSCACLMKSMATKFLDDTQAIGIGYFGESGTGKTHICIAIAQELTRRRCLSHRYFSYRTEIQKLKAAYYKDEAYSDLMGRWIDAEVLLIDDLFKFSVSKDGSIQQQDLQIMFDIINNRYLNRRITIFSSEYTVAEIKDVDAALGSRIFSMIHPYGMKCEGANRRFAEVQK